MPKDPPRPTGPDPAAYGSLTAFFAAHSISRSKGYELVRAGYGPQTTRIGSKQVVFAEQAVAWRARMAKIGTVPAESKYKRAVK
jgi:predicted DNA-binding transcriptional regulator AlpA